MAYSQASSALIKSSYKSDLTSLKVASSTVIYKGSLVFLKQGTAYNGLATGDLFAGVCTNTTFDDFISVSTQGIYPFKHGGITTSDVGKVAYVDASSDNQTVTVTKPDLHVAVGVVVDVADGYCFVRIDGYTYENVVIADGIKVTGVTLNNKTKSIEAEATYQLVATVSPDNATDPSVRWQSNNTDVVTVDDTGLITGIAAGKTTVVVTTNDGHYTAQCLVTVTE